MHIVEVGDRYEETVVAIVQGSHEADAWFERQGARPVGDEDMWEDAEGVRYTTQPEPHDPREATLPWHGKELILTDTPDGVDLVPGQPAHAVDVRLYIRGSNRSEALTAAVDLIDGLTNVDTGETGHVGGGVVFP